MVFKLDYKSHGDSEGKPKGAYFSPGYTTDVMNALSSVKNMPEVNKNEIGMWGHSLGGFLDAHLVGKTDITPEKEFKDWILSL